MNDHYDAISIGSGLGGLTAGALAALDGKKVLVLERHDRFGGAASTFSRKGCSFDVGLHEMDGMDENDAKITLVERLKLRENLDIVPINEFFTVRHPLLGEDFSMPDNTDRALKATINRFPQHEKNLRVYFSTITKIRNKVSFLARKHRPILYWILTAVTIPFRFWIIGKNEKTTLGGFLDKLFGDDEAVKIALCGNLCYFADDPYKLSLLFFAVGQGSFLCGGCHYIKGGSGKLSNYLVKIIEEAGGSALSGRSVDRILLEDGRAAGVTHTDAGTGEDSTESRSPLIFGNASPLVLGKMLPEEACGEFMARYEHVPLSMSLWQLYIILDRTTESLGVPGYSTFVYPQEGTPLKDIKSHLTMMGDPPTGKIPLYVIVDYGRIDSGICGDSKYVVAICGTDHISNWEHLSQEEYAGRKAAWQDAIISDVDRHFPGFKKAVLHCEMATAKTMKRFLNAPDGAVYGFSQEPAHAGRSRPTAKTSVDGLFLASGYAMPGGGFTGAMLAGQGAYRSAVKKKLL